MQKDDHLLDQYLKNKVEDAIFDFKEDYWLKASQMLDEEDKKKKRPLVWRWFAVICVVVAVGIGSFLFSNKHHAKKSQDKLAQRASSQRSTPAVAPSENAGSEKSYLTDRPQSQVNQSAAGNTNAPAGNDRESTPSNTAATQTGATPANHPQDTDHNSKDEQTAGVANTANAQEKTNRTPAQTNRSSEDQQNMQSKRTGKTKQKRSGRIAAANTSLPEKRQPQNTVADKEAENKAKNTVLLHGKTMTPKDTQTYVVRTPRDPAVSNPRYQASLHDYVADRLSDSVIVYNFTPLKTSKTTGSEEVSKKDSPAVYKKGIQLYLSGGAAINKGFKGNTGITVSSGIAPYINAGAEKQLSSKITLAAQIGFTYFNALNVQHKVVSYKYSFGFDSTSVAVEYRKLYQVLLPLSLAWQFSKNHQLWAAAGASYVMNTANRLNNNGIISHPTGYQEGINPFDLFAQLGYQVGLSRHIAVQAFLHQGFFSTTQKEFFNLRNSNTQTRVSLGLKYYFKRNGN